MLADGNQPAGDILVAISCLLDPVRRPFEYTVMNSIRRARPWRFTFENQNGFAASIVLMKSGT
jgi:hypothetical protein